MTTTSPQRFPILFTGANHGMGLIGVTPSRSWVEVRADEVEVHLGWGFRMVAPRAAIVSAAPDTDKVMGWGAHGWDHRWLVNGSSQNIVRLELDRPVRAWVAGFPVSVRTLRVSIVDPEAFMAALNALAVEE